MTIESQKTVEQKEQKTFEEKLDDIKSNLNSLNNTSIYKSFIEEVKSNVKDPKLRQKFRDLNSSITTLLNNPNNLLNKNQQNSLKTLQHTLGEAIKETPEEKEQRMKDILSDYNKYKIPNNIEDFISNIAVKFVGIDSSDWENSENPFVFLIYKNVFQKGSGGISMRDIDEDKSTEALKHNLGYDTEEYKNPNRTKKPIFEALFEELRNTQKTSQIAEITSKQLPIIASILDISSYNNEELKMVNDFDSSEISKRQTAYNELTEPAYLSNQVTFGELLKQSITVYLETKKKVNNNSTLTSGEQMVAERNHQTESYTSGYRLHETGGAYEDVEKFLKEILGKNFNEKNLKDLNENGELIIVPYTNIRQDKFDQNKSSLEQLYPGADVSFNSGSVEVSYTAKSLYRELRPKSQEKYKTFIDTNSSVIPADVETKSNLETKGLIHKLVNDIEEKIKSTNQLTDPNTCILLNEIKNHNLKILEEVFVLGGNRRDINFDIRPNQEKPLYDKKDKDTKDLEVFLTTNPKSASNILTEQNTESTLIGIENTNKGWQLVSYGLSQGNNDIKIARETIIRNNAYPVSGLTPIP